MNSDIVSIVDEFADLESSDEGTNIADVYNKYIATALESLNGTTINGIIAENVAQVLSIAPTDLIEYGHVSIKMNTDCLCYLGGTLVRDFRVFDFISEIFSGDNINQFSCIENIVLPKSVEIINSEAFYNYHFLKNVIFEDNSELRYIGQCAFMYCTKLFKLDLSACEKLEVLTDNIFACSGIKTVKLPDKLREISNKAFDNSNVTSVIVGGTKYKLGEFMSTLEKNNYHNFWDFETMSSHSIL